MSDYDRNKAIALLSYGDCYLEKWLANAIADDMRKLVSFYEAFVRCGRLRPSQYATPEEINAFFDLSEKLIAVQTRRETK